MKSTVHIDIGYFEKVTKLCFGGAKIDFARFSDMVCEGRERFRTYVYDCLPCASAHPSLEEMQRVSARQRFHFALSNLSSFEIRLGHLARDPLSGRYKQKRVDGLMTADIVRVAQARPVDAVVIVSGDEDLVPPVQEARSSGITTIVYHLPCYDQTRRPCTIASRDLLRSCDEARVIEPELTESCRLNVSAAPSAS